jgi:hypothetical protein
LNTHWITLFSVSNLLQEVHCQKKEKPNDGCGEQKKVSSRKYHWIHYRIDAISLFFNAGIVIQNYSFLGLIFIYLLKGNKINFLFTLTCCKWGFNLYWEIEGIKSSEGGRVCVTPQLFFKWRSWFFYSFEDLTHVILNYVKLINLFYLFCASL